MRRQVVSLLVLCLGIGLLAFAATGSAAADDVTIEVTVVDQNGDPVSGADVTVTWANGTDTSRTLPDGTAAFAVPDGANLGINVDHGAYVQNFPQTETNVTVPEGQSRATVTVPVSLAGSLAVSVEQNGEPEEDVKLRVRDLDKNDWVRATGGEGVFEVGTGQGSTGSFTTNADGNVTLNRIEQGEYEVVTSKAGFLETETEVTVDQNQVRETIPVEKARVNVDFKVTDDHFDPPKPLEGANINIEDRGIILETFSDGGQETKLPVNSQYDIDIEKEGYDGVTETLRIKEEAKEFSVGIQRTPAVNMTVQNTQVIVGQTTLVTVTNAYEEPIEGATVNLNGSEVGQTDAEGEAAVKIPTDGNHTISVAANSLEASATVEGFDPSSGDLPEDIQNQTEDNGSDGDEEEEAESENESDGDGIGAGFGIAAAALALLLTFSLGYVRRQ